MYMNHIHRQAALSLLKSGHSVTAATVQGGWRGRPDAPDFLDTFLTCHESPFLGYCCETIDHSTTSSSGFVFMNHIHRQAALSLLKSGHSVTAATLQGG